MAKIFSNIKERVLHIAEYYSISKESFCQIIDISYGNFKGKAKETPLNSTTVANILTNFQEINPRWLITGEGEMLENNISGTVVSEFGNNKTCTSCIEKEKLIHELLMELRGDKNRFIQLQSELNSCKEELVEARGNAGEGQKRKVG